MRPATPPRATVLVFGDLGRSPRMLNHALATAGAGIDVALVGYLESGLPREIAEECKIRPHPIRTFRRCPDALPRFVFLPWSFARLGWAQVQALWILMASTPRPNVVLAQNPPTIPTLFAARLGARLRGARFVLDWHNFGYSMLALRLGAESTIVKLLRRYERAAGRRADAHLCVSRAMAAALAMEAGIEAGVLYDRPTRLGPSLTREQRLAQLAALFPDAPLENGTLVLHCPTSWTDDEDVDMLLDAVLLFESQSPARLFVVVTGQGPRRVAFEARLADTKLLRCQVRTAFLSPDDYRLLLAAADCGISLHRSSSGVDLPMKLVDFFGAGTPALALDYGACLREQVRDGREALLFTDTAGLAGRFGEITSDGALQGLRRNVRPAWNETWAEAWRKGALPLLRIGS